MKIETANIKDLISPDYNPRHITPEALESLKRSLNEFGYISPLIVNEVNNHIVGGNQRYECLKKLGYETVEVSYVHIEDIEKEKALNIRLNNNSGDWDIGKLDNIFQDLEIKGFDLTLTGFETENLQPIKPESTNNETTNNTIPENETITTNLKKGLKPETKKEAVEQPETTNEKVDDDLIICPECGCEIHKIN